LTYFSRGVRRTKEQEEKKEQMRKTRTRGRGEGDPPPPPTTTNRRRRHLSSLFLYGTIRQKNQSMAIRKFSLFFYILFLGASFYTFFGKNVVNGGWCHTETKTEEL